MHGHGPDACWQSGPDGTVVDGFGIREMFAGTCDECIAEVGRYELYGIRIPFMITEPDCEFLDGIGVLSLGYEDYVSCIHVGYYRDVFVMFLS